MQKRVASSVATLRSGRPPCRSYSGLADAAGEGGCEGVGEGAFGAGEGDGAVDEGDGEAGPVDGAGIALRLPPRAALRS